MPAWRGASKRYHPSSDEPSTPPQVRSAVQKVFVLSPARVSGARAGLLLNSGATFPLAQAFHASGLPLGTVFEFASGLYFRGKLAYARRFAPDGPRAIRVITTNAGLLDPGTLVTPKTLREFGTVDIHEDDDRFRLPLERDSRALASELGDAGIAVLLGSIATSKYRQVLLDCLGDRLVFPADFVGRGDMSRGALLLRAAREGVELSYTPVRGAVFTGRRARRISEM